MRYRLLALDVDGTLLGPSGSLSPSVRRAVRSVLQRGVRVVVCTGRRYRTARPILEALDLDGPAVVQNGVLVKEAATGQTLEADYLPPRVYGEALRILSACGPPAVYIDELPDSGVDVVSERGDDHHPFLLEYLHANREHTRWVDSLDLPPCEAVVMISAMAGYDRLEELRADAVATLGDDVQTNLISNSGYRGHILEIASRRSGKWTRLREIARREGIADAEIVAIGDDTNDREMIEAAGLGIAMANAPQPIREAADHVTASNDEDGVARAIERFLLQEPARG